MFQCEMAVEAPDGSPIFQKRLSRIDLPGTDEAYKQENEMLAMLYRRHVEFAVGHNIAVHADMDPSNPNRAIRLSSRAVPSYEIPKTTPPTIEDADHNPAFAKLAEVVLDMKTLSDLSQNQLRSKLEPLVSAYRDWIEREKAKIDDFAEGLAHFKPQRRSRSSGARRPPADRGRADPRGDRRSGLRCIPFPEPRHVAPADSISLLRGRASGQGHRLQRRGHPGEPVVVSIPVGVRPAQPP